MQKAKLYYYPMKMQPICKDYLWGGERLKSFNKKSEQSIIAESWEISCNEAGLTKIENGIYGGRLLKDVVEISKEDFLGQNCKNINKFPLIIKFIDATKDLSVQVHPSETTADEMNNEFSKNEFWYIIDCEPDSFIYLGFNKDISKEEFTRSLRYKTVCKLLNKVNIKKGDGYYIPAGTIHALGKGILVAEIQQNSNTTFRVFDYDRRDANGNLRELHIDRAKDVLNFEKFDLKKYSKANFSSFECSYFKIKKENINKEKIFENIEKTFNVLQFIAGSGTIVYKNDVYNFEMGDTFFIPANIEEYAIKGTCELLITKI